ncbi:MAG: AI-2E family transporter [Polyangiaceae bacterium]|nr:AI-2E family transporter [Polyangiaceae bacterium]
MSEPRVETPPWLRALERHILYFVAAFGFCAVLYLLRGVLFQLFFAFLIAYALDPIVDKLEEWKIPRGLAAAFVLSALIVTFVLILLFTIPALIDEIRSAGKDLPDKLQGLEERMRPWILKVFKVRVPVNLSELVTTLQERIGQMGPKFGETVMNALFGTLGYIALLLSALIVPVFSLYLLIDFDRIVMRVGFLLPKRWEPGIRGFAGDVHKTLGSYVRGQITANLVLASLYSIGLWVVGVRLAVPIGILTGMLGFVPYIGFMLGLLLAVGMAAIDGQGGATQVALVVAVMGGVQILDGFIVTPRIVGQSVGLSPLEVLIMMMAAGSLFGFFGILFAVPLGAILKIAIVRFTRYYLKTDFYLKENT